MSEADLDRIERELSLHLPETYRTWISPFPVSHETGNVSSQIWADADRLIALNHRLRAEVVDWPWWLFAIGQAEGDPSGYAIDTRTPDDPVWWLEQMQLGPNSGPSEGQFAEWFARWVIGASEVQPTGRAAIWWLAVWVALSVASVAAVWLYAVRT